MRLFVVASSLLVACGGATAGTHPHDMSVAGHEQAATGEEQAGTQAHTAPCGGTPANAQLGIPCWRADIAPAELERHRQAAQAHRDAAQALGDAEARACVGIDDVDRDVSPFAHRADIESVEPLIDRVTFGRGSGTMDRRVGARVVFRATAGLTAEWLQRVIDCHLARNASLGHDVPEMPYCPLVPRGASARVMSVGNGFAVEIRGEGPEAAQEILSRAEQLAPR